ncbi:MAG: thiol peroxidase [Dysgonamonadaceae bacterium]|jgi:thiol peroxidase|nr:thiol peroxidase [Dysgonamonadaceae bacterium]
MATIAFKGNEIHSVGALPKVGSQAPGFVLVAGDLSEKTLADFAGKKVVLNIFPSIDTGVCAASVRKFNQKASELKNAVVLCISNDLPFAQQRFCGAEGLTNVIPLSAFRSDFGKTYGVTLLDSPLKGLLSRSVLVLDEKGKVLYSQQVEETTTEPDYEKALKALL